MPANRSRTTEWRRCLRQVLERNGALEIAVAQPDEDVICDDRHLIWRVRLLALNDNEILVEQPSALGETIAIQPEVNLAVILTIGQNRWMFATISLGLKPHPSGSDSILPCLRLKMPETVKRCQRRNYYRVETATLNLPEVQLWPLLDPKSVLIAERASEIQHEIDMGRLKDGHDGARMSLDNDAVMPEVGPKFVGTLLNLGGGGVGLRVTPPDDQSLAHHKLFWLQLDLPPTLKTPICATGKLVHTHIESNQDTYAGLAFDFTFNAGHQRFVVEQINRYIAHQQREQLRRMALETTKKKAA